MSNARQWVRDTAGGLPKPFWYLWAGTLFNMVASFVVVLLAFYLAQERGFSASYIGLVLGLNGAGGALGVLVGGVLADRWGRRNTMFASQLTAAASVLALGLMTGKISIAVVSFILGFANNASRPAFRARMVDILPEADRMRAFTLTYWAINLGFSIASVLAGLVAGVDFLLIFVVDAVATVISAFLIFFGVPEVRAPKPAGEAAAGRQPGLGAVFRDKVFMTYVLLILLTMTIFFQYMSTMPLSMQQQGFSPATYGFVIALNGVFILLGQLFVPKLLGNRPHSHVLAVATLLMGLGFGVYAFAEIALLYAFGVLIWTFAEMAMAPSNSTLTAELSPAALRGRYQGVFALAFSGASFLAPVLGGLVLEHAGRQALWLGCLAVGAFIAVAHLASGPARDRRVAELKAQNEAQAKAEAEGESGSEDKAGSASESATATS